MIFAFLRSAFCVHPFILPDNLCYEEFARFEGIYQIVKNYALGDFL